MVHDLAAMVQAVEARGRRPTRRWAICRHAMHVASLIGCALTGGGEPSTGLAFV
jgi:hypothetical protein